MNQDWVNANQSDSHFDTFGSYNPNKRLKLKQFIFAAFLSTNEWLSGSRAMKKISNLITLLPCQSLEDFPVDGSKQHAKTMLAAWTGLWHPALIADCEKAPTWRSAVDTVSSDSEAEQHRENYIQQHYYDDDGTASLDGQGEFEFDVEAFEDTWRDCLIVIPPPAASQCFAGFQNAASAVAATIVTETDSRHDWLTAIGVESNIDPELIRDFFSLGYVRFQVELMTLKLRYSSDLDRERFDAMVVLAAKNAAAGDKEAAQKSLQSAFDQLAEEKNRYYPTAADFVDLVLVAESNRPESIDAELESDSPKSFVMSGATIRSLADRSKQTTDGIAKQVEDGTVCIVGGPEHELPDNLLSIESILNQLKLGQGTCEKIFGSGPGVFMRRRFGLNASLPEILESVGFRGAIHSTFDQGTNPSPHSNSMRWMGVDGGAIMAIGETPIDAACDKSFLDLGVRIGTELDSAHVSTVFLARWPTQTCDSFEDLKNSIKYGSVLGDFTDADSYFENVYDPGYGDAYEADEYESQFFAQAIASSSNRPVSTFVNYWRHWYRLAAIRNLFAIKALADSSATNIAKRLDELQQRIELQTHDWDSEPDDSLSSDIDEMADDLLGNFDSDFVNTVPWKRNVYLTLDSKTAQKDAWQSDGAIKHMACKSSRCDAIVELSGFGQLPADTIGGIENIETAKAVKDPPVDDGESKLRNEFFEVRIDRQSGGIRGVHFYGKRGNLLSQRLAVRSVDQKTKQVVYSQMICDELVVETLSPIASQIVTTGKLTDADGVTLAKYTQTVGLQRGRNVIDLHIELSDIVSLDGSTSNYVANRIAWSDETAELFCDIQGGRHAVRKPQIEAPHFVEVVQAENRFALLSHGLPWHRRATKKMLDSILVAGNESKTSFRLGVAVNAQSAMQTAVGEMHPVLSGKQSDQRQDDPNQDSNWQFHLGNRNVIATWCSAVFDDDCRCSGMRVRLQEVEGREGKLKLYCRRKVESVEIESFDDQPVRSVALAEDNEDSKPTDYSTIETSFAAYEYFQLHVRWADLQ